MHSLQPEKIEVLTDHVIGFREHPQNGEILFVKPASMISDLVAEYGFSLDSVTSLTQSQFLMPGLVDTHTHPHMYVGAGTRYDQQLLEWVQQYVVPLEKRFDDVQLARDVYFKAVRRNLLHGTTTVSYCTTIQVEATKELCKIVENFGQRALIGKLNVDKLSPDYTEEIQDSLDGTRRFIKFVEEMNNPLIQAMVYPAALFTCTPELLKGVSQIAREHNLLIFSHVAEQPGSIKHSLSMNPGFKTPSSVFEAYDLLTDKTFMGHCVHLEKSEVQLYKQKGVGVAHCPSSNLCLRSGMMDVRRMLDMGVKVGLGTDVSGGYSSSILDAIRKSIDVSKAVSFSKEESYRSISHHEAFYMATLGGAEVLSLGSRIGNFVVGKEFDALLIDINPPTNTFDTFQWDSFDDILSKFLYLGDDRNILKRFVAGREIVV